MANKDYYKIIGNLNSIMSDNNYSWEQKNEYINRTEKELKSYNPKRSATYNRFNGNLGNILNDSGITYEKKMEYINSAIDKLSKSDKLYDLFQEEEQSYSNPYIDAYKKPNPNYNPITSGTLNNYEKPYEYDYNVDQAEYYGKKLQESGISSPVPDELLNKQAVEESKNKTLKQKLLEKGSELLDNKAVSGLIKLLSASSNAVNKGVQNLVDDDMDNSVFGGFVDGFKNTFNKEPEFTGVEDILNTLQESNNPVKNLVYKGLTAPAKGAIGLYNDITKKDMTEEDIENKSEGITGFVGDLLMPDALNAVDGVAKGLSLVTKGSDALKVGDRIGGIDNALNVVKKINPNATEKDAEYLLKKTTEILGGLDNYKGVTLGTSKGNINLVKPETIAKIGDYTIAKPLNKVREIMNNSSVKQGLDELFNNKHVLNARRNDSEALENIAFKKSINKRINKSNVAKEILQDDAKNINDTLNKNSYKPEDMTNLMETASKPVFSREQIVEKVNNPAFEVELNNERLKQLSKSKAELNRLKTSMVRGETNNQAFNMEQLNARISQLEDEVATYEDFGKFKEYYIDTIEKSYKDITDNGVDLNNMEQDYRQEVALDETPLEEVTPNIIPEEAVDSTIPKEATDELIEPEQLDVEPNVNEEDLNSLLGEPDLSDVQINQELADLLPQQPEVPVNPIRRLLDTDNNISNINTPPEVLKPSQSIVEPSKATTGVSKDYSDMYSEISKGIKVKNTNIGKANILDNPDKRIIMDKLNNIKSLSKTFDNIGLSKNLKSMSREDYNNEISRLGKIEDLWNSTEGSNLEKELAVKNFIAEEQLNKKISPSNTEFNKVLTDEQINALSKISDEARLKEEEFRKNGLLDSSNKTDTNIDEELQERLNANKDLWKNEVPEQSNIQKLRSAITPLKGVDDKWYNEVLNNIEKGNYKTKEQIQNVYNSIKTRFEDVPLDEETGADKLFNILNGSDSFAVKNINDARVAKGKAKLNHFNVNGADILIDSSVPKTKVDGLMNVLKNLPDGANKLLKNSNSLAFINSYLENGTGVTGKFFYDNKAVIMSSKENKTLYEHILSHELSHYATENPEDGKKIFDSIHNELKAMSKDEMEEFRQGLRDLGYNPSHEQARFLTRYAEVSFKNGNPTEQLAEFGGFILNANPKVREYVGSKLPSSKAIFEKVINDLPVIEKQLQGKPKYKELLSKLDLFKTAKESIEQDGNITKLSNRVDELFNATTKEELQSVVGDYVPKANEFKEIERTIWTKQTKDISRELVKKDLVNVFSKVQGDFKSWAKEEDIEGITDYVMHMLNSDLQGTRKGNNAIKKVFGSKDNIIKEPENIFSVQRKYKGTIQKVNKHFEQKYGVKNFFETNISKIYLARGLKHEDIMLKKNMFDDYMNLFSQNISKSATDSMNPAEKLAFRSDIKQKLSSGDYMVIQKNSHFKDKILRTVDDEGIEKGIKNRNLKREADRKVYKLASSTAEIDLGDFKAQINEPFTRIDAKDINYKEVFEKNDEYFIVSKDSFEMYNKTAERQFKKQTNGLLKAYDKFSNLWKAQAVLSGTFHVNNAIGNTFNSYLGIGLDILNPVLNTSAIGIQKGGKGKYMNKSYDEWNKIAKEYGVIGEGFFDMDVNNMIDKTTSAKSIGKKLNPLDSENFMLYSANRKTGGYIEDQARLVNFLSHVKSGKSFDEASDLVNKFLFDYSDLSDFETDVMKRIVPFYTFMRKNTPLQIEQLFKQPGKYGKIIIGMNDLGEEETEEQKMYKPDYMKDYIHTGNNEYRNINLPYKDLDKLTKPTELMSSTNPLIKYIIERSANKNLFYDSPIYEDETEKSDKLKEHALSSLIPVLSKAKNIPGAIEGDEDAKKKILEWVTGNKKYSPDLEYEKTKAKNIYLQKIKELETKAYKEGKITKKEKNPMYK